MGAITQTIGNTPLVRLDKLSAELGHNIYLKYEATNPGASIKDRAALSMIDHAEAAGTITPGAATLVEPTSGNTGIALALIGASRGYKVVLVMPESMSHERRSLLKMYGADLVLTPASAGMKGAVEQAEAIVAEAPDAWLVGQFDNPNNPLAHEQHTAPEIETTLGQAPDYVIAGVGTGATLSGTAHYFKTQKAATQFYAVEPAESPLISQAIDGAALEPGKHGIQGIGANFIPGNLDLTIVGGAIPVTTQEAIEQARYLASEEGILVGISSGANIAAVRRFAAEHQTTTGKTIVTFAPDTGERYISTDLFEK